ncbi:MAG: nucleotidyl transferase AbiEii/AbiGii toxin family protein [Bacteroidetes bacterium]|nr:nucleotidyl transferase AbiEii/AbiGii toxin family protein [Bacteroidota bacterium]
MLHYNTVKKSTLEFLIQLQKTESFSSLRLVGGTSLALQIGHRISVDIGLFGTLNEDIINVNAALNKMGQVTQLKNSKNINVYLLNDIKLDLVNYPYPWLENAVIHNGLRLAHQNDIAAMKIAAVTGRGTKKDFIDIYFLLKEMPLTKILELYQRKYSDGSLFMALKSLIYFDDAQEDEIPTMLAPVSWDTVKNTILSVHSDFLRKSK